MVSTTVIRGFDLLCQSNSKKNRITPGKSMEFFINTSRCVSISASATKMEKLLVNRRLPVQITSHTLNVCS
ncbi:hypothetical protein T4C_5622 [Trichinella pseudospiralis]|uniref:Uncharacterized protein n=1 Tax=Trichinella pseudospiralis TaxID=6337 RepID=A0A0V1G0C2_TRIPS|nr:hypothetical protein T4D_4667 [Trichinella pseudospiralis]KRZ44329.1 hypothetical protein T4C_5622 [Trichinella pseudospiralis]